uniref:Zinc transporter ZIP3 n=1 Tax=Steinernema glaseri TaxID=37863 RepID=A0A1I7Y4R8_9BILA
MDAMTLKIVLLIVMALVAISFGVLPVKVYQLLANGSTRRLANSRLSALLISLLSCFAGGVILGVCILDLLPSAKADFDELKEALSWKPHYPFVELLIGAGFFVVYLVEDVFDTIFKHHEESHIADDQEKGAVKELKCNDAEVKSTVSWITVSEQTSETNQSQASTSTLVDEKTRRLEERHSLVNSITFIIAFVFHTSLEGFAFGVQDTTMSIASLFFGIIVHKAIVSFSVGMRLIRSHPKRPLFVFALIFVLAITSPIGGVIGILVEDSNMNSTTKDIVSVILTSVSIGTFLFITFFEILSPERSTKHPKLLQWLATFVGFGLIAIMMLFGS